MTLQDYEGDFHAMSSPENNAAADSIAPPLASSPAMTISGDLLVAGILLLFVALAFAFVLYQYLALRSHRADIAGASSSHRGRRAGAVVAAANRGIDPEVLRALPVTVYRAKDFEEAVECAVCLAELADGEEARLLPKCGHGFHVECIDMWLHSHSTCPLCRLTISNPDVSSPRRTPDPSTLPPASPEPANYPITLPANVLFWGSQDTESATTTTTSSALADAAGSSSSGGTAMLVIEIPASPAPAHDTTKSPASARLRSLRRLWSRGRQGTSTTPCRCASASAGADIEQGVGIVEASTEVTSGAIPGSI